MSLESLKIKLPDYAKDIRLNLSAIETIASLTPQQLWGTVLTSAIATRNSEVIKAAGMAADQQLDGAAQTAARAAAAVMGMNNIYYRFLSLIGKEDYRNMPPRLRMNVIANPGVAKADFELWSLAASVINGCKGCIVSHEQALLSEGLTKEAVQDAVRIASILHAVATVLDAEAGLAGAAERAA